MPLSEKWPLPEQRHNRDISSERPVSKNQTKNTHAQEPQEEVDVNGHSLYMQWMT